MSAIAAPFAIGAEASLRASSESEHRVENA